MTTKAEDNAFRERMQHLEALIQEIERSADPAARRRTQDIVQCLLDLHAAGFEKLLEHLETAGEPGRAMVDRLTHDDLLSSLLLLYNLHPLDLQTRVQQALDRVRPYVRSHGGNIELVDLTDGRLRLRLQGSCHSCPSSAQTLKNVVEEAILEKAPDIESLEVEGVTDPPPAAPATTFVPVEALSLRV
jgi:Fe-S cluster biogenesis protein NfuA